MTVRFLTGQGKSNSESSIDQNIINKIQNLMQNSFNIYNKGKFFELALIKKVNKNDLAFVKKDENFKNTQSIYIYNNGVWNLLLNALTLDDAISFLIDDKTSRTDSTFSSVKLEEMLRKKVNQKDLAPVAKTNNFYSLNNRPRIPTKTSDLSKDDLFTKDEINKKLEIINKLKDFLTSIEGKIKNNKNDKSEFLSEKLDNTTIRINENNHVQVINIDGLEIKPQEINLLKPIIPNINSIISLIDSQNPLNQFDYKGSVDTVLSLNSKEKKAGNMYLVIHDENHEQKQTMYISDGDKFSYICDINGDKLSRDFFKNPLNLNNEVTNILNENYIDKNIARKKELDIKINKVINSTENNIAILDSNGNIKDGLESIDKLAKTIHSHIARQIDVDPTSFEKNFTIEDNNLQKILNKLDTLDFDLSGLIDDNCFKNNDKTYSINKIIELLNNKMDKGSFSELDNFETLKLLNNDKEGNLLFNNKKINMDIDLSKYSTSDLKDSKDKHYLNDIEKNNLNKLDNFVKQQNSINTKLNNINQSIPNDISSNNSLISNSQLNNKIKNIRFTDLIDIEKPLTPNSILMTNKEGSKIITKNKLNEGISEISDNNNTFLNVKSIKFNNMIGVFDPSKQKIELTLNKIYSENLLDMPKDKINNGVLVSNKDTNKYELKDFYKIFNSQENFCKEISKNSWSPFESKFKTFIDHGLNSESLLISFYDEFKNNINLKYKIENNNLVTVYTDSPIYCKCIINCSQSGKGNQNSHGGSINVSDIIDDKIIDVYKTYSSKKIDDLFYNTLNKNETYTKKESNNLFALKELEHWHNNMNTINSLKEDDDGNLIYKNKKIMTSIKPFFYECHWDSQSNLMLDDILNVKDIYNSKNYSSIMSSEFTIKNINSLNNKKEIDKEDYVCLKIFDNNILVLDVRLSPEECQKYQLGISPNIIIQVQGLFDANYYITAL